MFLIKDKRISEIFQKYYEIILLFYFFKKTKNIFQKLNNYPRNFQRKIFLFYKKSIINLTKVIIKLFKNKSKINTR